VPEDVERQDVEPEGLEGIRLPDGRVPIRIDKLLVRCGLAESMSDASRKLKQKAVKIDGEINTEPLRHVTLPVTFTLRVGKRLKVATILKSLSS
jgi:tyrosyl-tRNA synthetase